MERLKSFKKEKKLSFQEPMLQLHLGAQFMSHALYQFWKTQETRQIIIIVGFLIEHYRIIPCEKNFFSHNNGPPTLDYHEFGSVITDNKLGINVRMKILQHKCCTHGNNFIISHSQSHDNNSIFFSIL